MLNLLLTFGDFEILVEPDDRHHGGHCRRKICGGLKLVVGAQRDSSSNDTAHNHLELQGVKDADCQYRGLTDGDKVFPHLIRQLSEISHTLTSQQELTVRFPVKGFVDLIRQLDGPSKDNFVTRLSGTEIHLKDMRGLSLQYGGVCHSLQRPGRGIVATMHQGDWQELLIRTKVDELWSSAYIIAGRC